MLFLIYRLHQQLRLVCAQGAHVGTQVALADQVLLSDFELNPEGSGALASGEIIASWGLVIDESLDLPTPVRTGLGINRPFRMLPRLRRAVLRSGPDGDYLAHPTGGMLNVKGKLLHLFPDRAEYSL